MSLDVRAKLKIVRPRLFRNVNPRSVHGVESVSRTTGAVALGCLDIAAAFAARVQVAQHHVSQEAELHCAQVRRHPASPPPPARPRPPASPSKPAVPPAQRTSERGRMRLAASASASPSTSTTGRPPTSPQAVHAARLEPMQRRQPLAGKGGLVRLVRIPHDLADRLEERRRPEPACVTDHGVHYLSRYDVGAGRRWSASFSAASRRALGGGPPGRMAAATPTPRSACGSYSATCCGATPSIP